MLPGHARPRADQRQRGHRHGLRVDADRPDDRADRDRQGVPHLHAARRACSRSRSRRCSSRRSRGSRPAATCAGFRDTVSLGPAPDRLPPHPRRASSPPSSPSRSSGSLYERGEFEPDQTPVVAGALAAFSLGLAFNGMMLMLNRGFFSLQAPWIPTVVALANLALNAALYAVFYRVGAWGIPLAISLANIAGVGAAARRAAAARSAGSTCTRRSRSFVLGHDRRRGCSAASPTASGACSTTRSAARSRRSSSRSARRSSSAASSTSSPAARSGCARSTALLSLRDRFRRA